MTRDEVEMISEGQTEYELAYDVVRYAMEQVVGATHQGRLQALKCVLDTASFFVNHELDELEDKARKLGLDEWQREQEWEEAERREREAEEREDREREQAIEAAEQLSEQVGGIDGLIDLLTWHRSRGAN